MGVSVERLLFLGFWAPSCSGLLAQLHIWLIDTLGLRGALGLTILWLVDGLGEDQ